MLPYRDSRIVSFAIGAFLIIVVLYGIFEAQGMVFGPRITLSAEAQTVHDPFVLIKGHADRIDSLKMQGKDIEVTEDGSFSEPYLLTEGVNRIVFDATDKYGHTSKQVVNIVYEPATSTSTAATTTASTTATATSATSSTSTQVVAH